MKYFDVDSALSIWFSRHDMRLRWQCGHRVRVLQQVQMLAPHVHCADGALVLSQLSGGHAAAPDGAWTVPSQDPVASSHDYSPHAPPPAHLAPGASPTRLAAPQAISSSTSSFNTMPRQRSTVLQRNQLPEQRGGGCVAA